VAARDCQRLAGIDRQQDRKCSILSASKRSCGGNCHRMGPSFSRSANTPEASTLASGVSMPRSLSMWVMKRLPLTAKMKPGGVAAYQAA
jgi:hypothetical protein